jgi:uncharacterized membrane protein YfbV (UPF0208 family)
MLAAITEHALAVQLDYKGLYWVGDDRNSSLQDNVLPVCWANKVDTHDPTSKSFQPAMSQEKWIDEWLPSRYA